MMIDYQELNITLQSLIENQDFPGVLVNSADKLMATPAIPFQVTKGETYIYLKSKISKNAIFYFLNNHNFKKHFYFKNKTNLELLALGEKINIKSEKELIKFEKMTNGKNDKDLLIVGATRFNKYENLKQVQKEWRGIDHTSFFIPQVYFLKNDSSPMDCAEIVIILDPSDDIKTQLFNIIESTTTPVSCHREGENYQVAQIQNPSKSTWSEMITNSLNKFSNKELTKVVLSRKIVTTFNESVQANDVFKNLKLMASSNSYLIHYKIDDERSFMSVSPEKLYSNTNNQIEVDVIAGTITNEQGLENDHILLNDQKELNEHRIVLEDIKNHLSPLCDEIRLTKKEELLKLKHIKHIHSLYQGQKKEETSNIDLISSLHPTPAVGGFPKKDAMNFILEAETYQRGFYAAPIGIISQDHSEFCVGIRSCLVTGREIHVYGGCGIVPGSLYENEWLETHNKMKNFKGIINLENNI